jgi:pimeloyl-ACP methyl ester carboxylesterase
MSRTQRIDDRQLETYNPRDPEPRSEHRSLSALVGRWRLMGRIAGRESEYFGHFLRFGASTRDAFSDADVARYVKAYARPEQLAAGLGFYRSKKAERVLNMQHTAAIQHSVVFVFGEKSFGSIAGATDARRWGVVHSSVVVIPGSGHYVPDERPMELVVSIRAAGSRMP